MRSPLRKAVVLTLARTSFAFMGLKRPLASTVRSTALHASVSSNTSAVGFADRGSVSRWDAVVRGGAAMGLSLMCAPPAAAAVAVRRSDNELQYELFKKALDCTQAFEFAEAEAAYTSVIRMSGERVNALNEREKFLLARAYSNRGNARSMLNRMEEALVDYSRALDLAPDCSTFWVNRGLAYESVADMLLDRKERDAKQFYQFAMQDYEHAIVLDPSNHRLYVNAGDVLTRLERHDRALESYRKALALFPVSPSSRGKVALMEAQVGNIERANYIIGNIIMRNPDYAEMLLASAAMDWNLGLFVEGRVQYAYAVDRDPRLLDDQFLRMALHWPPVMMGMVRQLRMASSPAGGLNVQAVSWFQPGAAHII